MKLVHLPLNTGSHMAGWRWPGASPDGLHDLGFYQSLARAAERGKFDALFFADSIGFYPIQGRDAFSRADVEKIDPVSVLAALSATTSHLGLCTTASTTYSEPFTLARQFASIDHLSGGRAGWNVVTSAHEEQARNYGRDRHMEHDQRYERAREFVEVVRGLWDSFEDGALLVDKAGGRYVDPARLHAQDFQGRYIRMSGSLNVARPPQGHPVLFQAGGSGVGKRFAADYADVIFSSHSSLGPAQAFYAEIKAMAAEAGRDPDHVKVLSSIHQVVAPTEGEARAILDGLNDLIPDDLAISVLQTNLGGFDLSPFDPDGPLPEVPPGQIHGVQGQLERWARVEGLTIRQIARRHAAQRTGSLLVGTPEAIADVMQQWFQGAACDGFVVSATYLPGGLEAFVDQVVPVLQARGLFRTDYEGETLRENLGIPRPPNTFAVHPERHVEPGIW